jgi:hypothetical protein
MAARKLVLKLAREKETPGTVRYIEVPDEDGKFAEGMLNGPGVGTQYIKKYAAKALGDPKTITVTIEAE